MQLKVKALHPEAILPTYAKPGDAGLDISTINHYFEKLEDGDYLCVYETGLAIELPEDHLGLLFPRSSVSKKSLSLSNCVGVIDQDFRGQVLFKFRVTKELHPNIYADGDRVGQLVVLPFPKMEPVFVDELSTTERGTGGFGSTNG